MIRKDSDIAEARRILRLSSLEKPNKVAPVKLPNCILQWIKQQGPVSTYLRHLVLEELQKMVDGRDE